MSLNDNLAHLMIRADLDPARLAERAQVNPDNLRLYLQGHGGPCPMEQRRLSLALQVPIETLHAGTWEAA